MNEIVKTATQARQGSKEGIVRYVLAISTAAVIIGLFAVWFVVR